MSDQTVVQETLELTPFQLAMKKRQEDKAAQEEAKNNASWGDYEKAEVAGLIKKTEVVGRVLGSPIEIRSKCTDPKLILQSEVVKDDKKHYWKLNWPWVVKNGYINPDPEWIVTRFMNKVMSGKWVKYTEEDIDGKKIIKKEGKIINTETKSKYKEGYFKYDNTGTEIFKLLKYGNSKEGELFPKDFAPTKRVICNWIDRHDSWCSDNKHSKILCASKEPYEITKEDGTKNTIYFTSTGIPMSLYDMIMDHCNSVGTLDIDLVITKDADLQAKYKVFDITDYPKYVTEASHKIGKQGKLTIEELAYELYDLDKLYKISSYQKIKRVLGSRMALCDAELGTKFVEELNELVKKEKEEWEANRVYWYHAESDCVGICTRDEFEKMCNGPATGQCEEINKERYEALKKELEGEESKEPETKVPESKAPEVKKEEIKKEEPARRGGAIVQSESIEELCAKHFAFWSQLPDVEKQVMIASISKFDGTIPVYKEQGHPGCSNKECFYAGTKIVTLVPNGVNSCPVCGVAF